MCVSEQISIPLRVFWGGIFSRTTPPGPLAHEGLGELCGAHLLKICIYPLLSLFHLRPLYVLKRLEKTINAHLYKAVFL